MKQEIFDFELKLQEGQDAEAFLCRFLEGRGYEVTPAREMALQRRGIDAQIYHPKTGIIAEIEFKCDARSEKTGNLFLETESVHQYDEKKTKKLGWVYTTECDYLIYCAVGRGILVFSPDTIREVLPSWMKKYPLRDSLNKQYFSVGLCVPYSVVALVSVQEYPWEEVLPFL